MNVQGISLHVVTASSFTKSYQLSSLYYSMSVDMTCQSHNFLLNYTQMYIHPSYRHAILQWLYNMMHNAWRLGLNHTISLQCFLLNTLSIPYLHWQAKRMVKTFNWSAEMIVCMKGSTVTLLIYQSILQRCQSSKPLAKTWASLARMLILTVMNENWIGTVKEKKDTVFNYVCKLYQTTWLISTNACSTSTSE